MCDGRAPRQRSRAPYLLCLDAPLRFFAVVVAKDPLVRSGLSALLGAYPALVVSEGVESLARSPAGPFDVVVWDMPAEGAAELANLRPRPAVLAMVEDAGEAQSALGAGALGALPRSAPLRSIGPAAVAVAGGHTVVDPRFRGALFAAVGGTQAESVVAPRGAAAGKAERSLGGVSFTRREQEVLALVAEGLSNRLIAERLGISRHTAKFHVKAILDKLGAETRTEAVVLAARRGLLTL